MVTFTNTAACFTFCSTSAGIASSAGAARAVPATSMAAMTSRRMSLPDFLLLGFDFLFHRVLRRKGSGRVGGGAQGEHDEGFVGRNEVRHGEAGQLPLEDL